MRKITLLFIACGFLVSTGFSNNYISIAPTVPSVAKPATEPTVKPVTKINANSIMIPVGKTGKKISLMELSTIKLKDLETLTGKQMNFVERLAFHKTQKKLSKGIDNDGYVTNKKLNKVLHSKRAGDSGFHLGGFALGFFLGLIGVLLAYVVFNDDYKSNRIKWSWIGCAAAVVLSLILIIGVFASVT